MDIQVILTQDDPKLGKRGDVVKVSSGHAQNFLYPHHKAKPATAANLKTVEDEKKRSAQAQAESLAAAQAFAAKISSLSLTLEVQAGENDKMYGAVTAQEILQALSSKAISLDKRQVQLPEPIKKLGTHSVPVKLHPQVMAELKISVVKKK